MSRTERKPGDELRATIATVERETGLSKDTLRVWERRYGFPCPERDSRGERLYPSGQVEKLRVISRLLDTGLRPGQLMKVPVRELLERLQARAAVCAATGAAAQGALSLMMEDGLGYLRCYDEPALRAHLSRALLRLGLQRFVIEYAAPLNELVGDAWARGDISVSHEHLYTEQMQQLLRREMASIPAGAQQPRVLLTTLPGEEHQIGLLMAQVCLAAEGARCISLGVQTPASDIAEAARQQGVDAVGLSFSEALRLNVAGRMLEDLRARLPAHMEIWAGGKLWTRARRTLEGVRFVTLLTQIPDVLAAQRAAQARQAGSS